MGRRKGWKEDTAHGWEGGLTTDRGQMVEEGKTEHRGGTEGKG